MSDPISDRLSSLRGDVDRMPYPAPSEIRRRGQRRSALQVGGSVVAVAALAGGGFLLLPDGSTDPNVIASTTPSYSTAGALTAAALLSPEDLPTSRPSNGPWLVLADGSDPSIVLADQCGPSSQFGGAEQQLVRTFTSNGTEVGAYAAASESLFADADATTAATRAEVLSTVFAGCGAPDGVTGVPRTWNLQGAADGGALIELARNETATTPGGYTYIAVARTGSVTAVVTLTVVSPEPITLDGVLTLVHDALAKVCTNAALPCPSVEVTATEVDPTSPTAGPSSSPPPSSTPPTTDPTTSVSASPALDSGMLLPLEDMPTWDRQMKWASAQDVDPSTTQYGNVCTIPWRDSGATGELLREYLPGGKGDPTYTDHSAQEALGVFADDSAAEDAVSSVVKSLNSCESNPDAPADLTSIPMDGAPRDTAWVVSFPSAPDARTMLYTGLVRSGPRVALVMVQYEGNGDLAYETFIGLLQTAGDLLAKG